MLNYTGVAFDATRPFPERRWSLPSNSRQGFLTPGSSALLHGLPDLTNEISDHPPGSYAIAGIQWREPCGLYTRFPCHPLWVPVTVNQGPPGHMIEIAILVKIPKNVTRHNQAARVEALYTSSCWAVKVRRAPM